MANNYLQFSFTVPATQEQADWVGAFVATCHDRCEGIGEDADYDQDILRCLEGDLFPDVEIEYLDNELWFHADESGDVEFTANLVHEFLNKFSLDHSDPIAFEWACTCSRPRPGEFSGGAAFVTKDGVEFMTTGTWIGERLMAFRASGGGW